MKKLILSIVITLFFLSLISFKSSILVKNINDRQRVEIIFSHKLSFNDIVKMKLDLSENNIFLTFRKLGFDENSMLISVEYQVKYERYMASDKLENLTDDSHLGFLIDQSKEKKFDIACGNLDDIKKKFSLN